MIVTVKYKDKPVTEIVVLHIHSLSNWGNAVRIEFSRNDYYYLETSGEEETQKVIDIIKNTILSNEPSIITLEETK